MDTEVNQMFKLSDKDVKTSNNKIAFPKLPFPKFNSMRYKRFSGQVDLGSARLNKVKQVSLLQNFLKSLYGSTPCDSP